MSAEVADVLDKAAEVIETRGWRQGAMRGPNGAVCVVGAIQGCTSWSTFPFIDAVKRHNGIFRKALVEWNDEPGRTAAEVIAALRNAAAVERAS